MVCQILGEARAFRQIRLVKFWGPSGLVCQILAYLKALALQTPLLITAHSLGEIFFAASKAAKGKIMVTALGSRGAHEVTKPGGVKKHQD